MFYRREFQILFFLVVIFFTISILYNAGMHFKECLTNQMLRDFQIQIFPQDYGQPSYLNNVKKITNCKDRNQAGVRRIEFHSAHYILYNYFEANRTFQCHESITFTTHGTFKYLENVVSLVERWRGPISVAVLAPGYDLIHALNSMQYLRECTSPLVKEFVTFHILIPSKHLPKEKLDVPKRWPIKNTTMDCHHYHPPYTSVDKNDTYQQQNRVEYMVNIARNVARESATTYFILASDIELYPSINIIPNFLQMIARNEAPLNRTSPRVFTLPIFEVSKDTRSPITKQEVQELMFANNGSIRTFHEHICDLCHRTPRFKEWKEMNITEGLHVHSTIKRHLWFGYWEPIYIGTHADPLYDERFSWDGMSDKMTQAHILCTLDYDFMSLDNAFLVHKPGIKTQADREANYHNRENKNKYYYYGLKYIVYRESVKLYGYNWKCVVS